MRHCRTSGKQFKFNTQYTVYRLTVLPGAIALESWPIVRRLILHDRGSVIVIRARFAPPWWRTGFILRGDGRSYGFAPTTTGASRSVGMHISAEFW
jgi:hypothetical protein